MRKWLISKCTVKKLTNIKKNKRTRDMIHGPFFVVQFGILSFFLQSCQMFRTVLSVVWKNMSDTALNVNLALKLTLFSKEHLYKTIK